jgi:hypothetical protein
MSHESEFLNAQIVQSDTEKLVSKILVCDDDENVLNILKEFCIDHNLIGYKVQPDSIMDVLQSNIDLGGILISEDVIKQSKNGIELLADIHRKRGELPVFLRCNNNEQLDDYAEDIRQIFAGAYKIDRVSKLKELIDKYLFGNFYPEKLVAGIRELSYEAFSSAFKDVEVISEIPYIVKDKIIYGELFSLIALESDWCRGYMMLQSEEASVMDVISAGKTHLGCKNPNFRDVNTMLSEVSNLIWGSFKSRFIKQDLIEDSQFRIQVPIIVNHGRKYISFGSDDPQLCFKYTLNYQNGELAPINLYQKFVFSLAWSPEKFKESQQEVDSLVQGGELELF